VSVSESEVRAAIVGVEDPELQRGIGELGLVRAVRVQRKSVTVTLGEPAPRWPGRDGLTQGVQRALAALADVGQVVVAFAPMDKEETAELVLRLGRPPGGEPSAPARQAGQIMAPGSRTRVIGISSGKGGVGKSSVTVNLAVALAQTGAQVGLLDADVYGFSVPKMIGIDHEPVAIGGLLIPPIVHGVRCMSMGFFVPDEQPVIWRGPMLHKALQQFLVDAYWGEPDYLLVDMPPGTGDVALSLAEYLPRTEIYVVTTPQAAAQRVAQRSAYAARKLKLSVRGVIENMAWFLGDDGTRYELFGRGGGQALAQSLEVPLLGQIPLVPSLRQAGDDGVPVRVADPSGEASAAFDALAEKLVAAGPVRIYRRELTVR
jgi:ATP-binding protein involved in chromosome partitioning